MKTPDVKTPRSGAEALSEQQTNPKTTATGEASQHSRPDLKAHPLALLVPEMLRDEFVELVADIKAHGLRQPIVVFENEILDGRHRHQACVELGIVPTVVNFTGTTADAKAYVMSVNVHRRHLTPKQKTEIVVAELKRDPSQSDRSIATKAKVSPTTVGKVRAKAEATGKVSTVDTIVGKDGVRQPVTKTVKVVMTRLDATPKVVNVTTATAEPKSVDLLAQFKAYARVHLMPLPIGERSDMARKWVAHINTIYLPERLSPPAEAAKEAVDAGEVPHVH